MADFCAGCTATAMEPGGPENDLLGWLGGRQGHGWALCEGCGVHLFNDRGERRCRRGDGPAMGLCAACTELERVGGVHVVDPRRSRRCDNCSARLGFAWVSGLAEVGPVLAPYVDLADGGRVCLMCFYPF